MQKYTFSQKLSLASNSPNAMTTTYQTNLPLQIIWFYQFLMKEDKLNQSSATNNLFILTWKKLDEMITGLQNHNKKI